MNLYHLRYFVALARLEHYTRAAERLNITQPGLSHAIASLEKELGVTLFDHEGRNVVLSKCGRLFLEDVERSLALLDRGIDRMKKIAEGSGTIDLGFLRGLGAGLVPKLISAFRATEVGKAAEFHLATGATRELLDGLEDRTYDVVLTSGDESVHHCEFLPMQIQELVLVVPQDHPLAQRTKVRLEDTLEEPHILFDQSAAIRNEIDRLYASLPRMPRIAYEVQEAQDIAGLVANHFGVAVLQDSYILRSLPVKVLHLEHQEVRRYIYLAVSKHHYLPPHVRAFRDFAVDYARMQYKVYRKR